MYLKDPKTDRIRIFCDVINRAIFLKIILSRAIILQNIYIKFEKNQATNVDAMSMKRQTNEIFSNFPS